MSTETTQVLADLVTQFNTALVNRDADTLKALTSEGLSYGHSKGKIENQESFVGNLLSEGATQFTSIEIENQTIELVGDNAIIRHTFKAATSKNGVAGNLEIQNMMVWKNVGSTWVLIARQAFSF